MTTSSQSGMTPVEEVNGWILIQERRNAFINFDQSWADFKNGFGLINSSYYWMGLDRINFLTKDTPWRLLVDMLTVNGTWMSAEYDKFQVDNESAGYVTCTTINKLNFIATCQYS